jgi:hypothetical protein
MMMNKAALKVHTTANAGKRKAVMPPVPRGKPTGKDTEDDDQKMPAKPR